MSIEKILSQATALAVKQLYGADFDAEKIEPQPTRKEFEGNETIVVFPFLKMSKKATSAATRSATKKTATTSSAADKPSTTNFSWNSGRI